MEALFDLEAADFAPRRRFGSATDSEVDADGASFFFLEREAPGSVAERARARFWGEEVDEGSSSVCFDFLLEEATGIKGNLL